MNSFLYATAMRQQILMTVLFIMLIMLMLLISLSFSKRKNTGSRYALQILNIVIFAAVFITLILLRADFSSQINNYNSIQYLNIPVLYIRMFLIAAGTYILYALILEFFHKKKTVDRNSIRESINTLPAGVCYFSENGLIKLCNFQMYRLYRSITQSELQSVNELHNALLQCSRTSGVIRVSDKEPVFLFPDGKAWMYSENTMEAGDGSKYIEVIFSNVTELYEKKAEIEKQTKILEKINKNIRLLSSNVAAMTKEEEILSFKTQLHDRLGAGIVAARQVLLHRLPADEMDEVIRMWKQSVEFIEHDNNTLSNNSALSDLLHDADAIGVSIRMDGILPEDKDILELFINAMRECLTNCVRHAEGTELYVKCMKEDHYFILTITNNGKNPEGEITPCGGLTNLIRQTEYHGGKIEILSSPEFRLMITMPERRCKI